MLVSFWNDKGGYLCDKSSFDLAFRPSHRPDCRSYALHTISDYDARTHARTYVRSQGFSSIAQRQPHSDHADFHILHHQFAAFRSEYIYGCIIKFFDGGRVPRGSPRTDVCDSRRSPMGVGSSAMTGGGPGAGMERCGRHVGQLGE